MNGVQSEILFTTLSDKNNLETQKSWYVVLKDNNTCIIESKFDHKRKMLRALQTDLNL